MPDKSNPAPSPVDSRPDPTNDALPIDDIGRDAVPDTTPDVETAVDDDEGGADPIDPDTGQPYDDTDAGTDLRPATRRGGTDNS